VVKIMAGGGSRSEVIQYRRNDAILSSDKPRNEIRGWFILIFQRVNPVFRNRIKRTSLLPLQDKI
jgi:hypothetical protein